MEVLLRVFPPLVLQYINDQLHRYLIWSQILGLSISEDLKALFGVIRNRHASSLQLQCIKLVLGSVTGTTRIMRLRCQLYTPCLNHRRRQHFPLHNIA